MTDQKAQNHDHTAGVDVSTVADLASVSCPAEKKFNGSDKFQYDPFYSKII